MFSYQGSCRSLSSDSFNILSNCIRSVKNFFLFLLSPTGQLRYSTTFIYRLSTIFYKFFQLFSPLTFRHYIWYFYPILSTSLPGIYKNYRELPVVFADDIERRRRDLNPRAATNDLLPFQGSPFGQLGYFSKMSAI